MKVRQGRPAGMSAPRQTLTGARERAEDLQERRLLAKFGERGGDRGLVAMAFDVDIEVILPRADARRARLETGHGYTMARQRLQQLEHGAWLVRHRHDQRGLVVPANAGALLADHHETRAVVR